MKGFKSDYEDWLEMVQLCEEKGIEIDQNWRYDFMAFHRIMGEKPEGSVLTRVEGEWGFTPGNCIWAFPIVYELNGAPPKFKDQYDSGCDGVVWCRTKRNWRVKITMKKIIRTICRCDDLFDAIEARKKADKLFRN